MDKIKTKRAVFRASFSRTFNVLKSEIEKGAEKCDKGILADKIIVLEDIRSKLKVLDDNILDCLLDAKADEELIYADMIDAENYIDDYITMKRVVNEILNTMPKVKEYRNLADDNVLLFSSNKTHETRLYDTGGGSPTIEMLSGSDIYERNDSDNQTRKNSNQIPTNPWIEEFKKNDLQKKEIVRTHDIIDVLSQEEEEEEYLQNHTLKELPKSKDGQNCTALPRSTNMTNFTSSIHITERQMVNKTKKGTELTTLDYYTDVLLKPEEEEITKVVFQDELEAISCPYITHYRVIKFDSKTTEIRTVLNASGKNRNPRLNDCLLKSTNLIEQIPTISLQFVGKRFGVISDIKGSFLQIEKKKQLQFSWWEKKTKLKIIQYHLHHMKWPLGVDGGSISLENERFCASGCRPPEK